MTFLFALFLAAAASPTPAETVLVVANRNSSFSGDIANYYIRRRSIPPGHVCLLDAPTTETINRDQYVNGIEKTVANCLVRGNLTESVLYIVTTRGVPLRISGTQGTNGDQSAVDSELALLYAKLKGFRFPVAGAVPNPYFGKADAPFRHPDFAIYLVTRLAAYDLSGAKALVDRSLGAKNRGKFVIDTRGEGNSGDASLKDAAIRLPSDRTVFDDSKQVLRSVKNVIGYASWGSNDHARVERKLGFEWLPGAIVTEFVSTNARTFERPPDSFVVSADWSRTELFFAGAPQTLIGDYLEEGATGASGHVYEPYLHLTPRPEKLLPAYLAGRNLAESFYGSIPALSWQNIVVGDPLCHLQQ